VPPTDRLQDVRSKIMLALIEAGIPVEVQHHEVGTAGQAEIDIRFGTLVQTADRLLTYKYIVKNVCHSLGYTATFMPKPLFGDNGSGMHCHQSLWKGDTPLFFDESGYAGLSELARHYIGGLIAHAPALLAICAPTTNSYRRLVPGFEAPVNLMYSARNRSAICRIPMYSNNPKAKRVEFRAPDPTANPYLAFAAMLMAGLDGIKRRLEPPAPIDEDLYELHDDRKQLIKMVPGSLAQAVNALEQDHDFLLEGDVFTPDVLETWITMKRTRDIAPVDLRPHPYEFFLYYDA
jgi:glutamine synthetase